MVSNMLIPLQGFHPKVDPTAFIAPGAVLVGRCRLGKRASVWYNTVLRGDVSEISVGDGSNVQDGSILHVDFKAPLRIGKRVTVGHHVNLHGCQVADDAVVGMGAIVLSRAKIGKGAVVAAGSLVPEGARVPAGKLVMGIPARVVRSVTPKEAKAFAKWVGVYEKLARIHGQVAERRKAERRRE